jgi:DNA-binding Lrp family transcriptional regulator
MADINRIKQLAEEEVIERPDDYISLERIVSEIPMLDYENPITYHLYATYNKNILSEEEKANVLKSIENLKKKRDRVNERCAEYLEQNGSTPVENIEEVIQISSSGI